ncbi:MAG: methyltransferase [Sphingobacteriales bacterium 50-39]|nr:methyltransferase [Sphingobacteriales bacterium]OJW55977.1 MAG: methyltransferase [Sphingobacteriales bacterium 50-39]
MPAPSAAESKKTDASLDPSKIMQIGMGFWPSKVLLTAVRFGLFTQLGQRPLSGREVKEKLGLSCSPRHVFDWLDTLVSLGFLERKGLLQDAVYSNAEDTGFFLDKNKPAYMGGILEMADARLYNHWRFLDEGLLTGRQQNEGKGNPHGNMEFFTDLYKDENKLKEFIDAMRGIQTGNFIALTEQFDFSNYSSFVDIGGADGWLSVQICLHHPAIHCTTFDLPPVQPLAERLIAQFHLTDRIRAVSGDFRKDPLPAGDVIAMGNILHGMNEEAKEELLKKVYDALPENGVFIAIENIIDDQRTRNTFGLLMSLNMLIENGDAFDYSMADFTKWARSAGFSRIESKALAGPASAAIAYK